MSIAALNWVFGAPRQCIPSLTGPKDSARHVLIALANHADERGECWPSIDTIAGQANVSRTSVKRCLRWLEDQGYIVVDMQANTGGRTEMARQPRHRTNVYRLLWDAESGVQIGTPQSGDGGPDEGDRGSKSDDSGVQMSSLLDVTPHTRTTTKPSAESSRPAEPGGGGLTAGQVADRIMRDYWAWVEKQAGRAPIAVTVLGFKNVITPFLEAGIEAPPIKQAVAALYLRGVTLTRATLENELDGRGYRGRPPSQDQKLAGQRFTVDGKLIPRAGG